MVTSLISCNQNDNRPGNIPIKESKEEKVVNKDSIDKVRLEEEYESKKPEISYQQIVLKDRKHRNQIIHEHDEDPNDMSKNRAFCLLNRKARRYMRVGDTVVVPNIYSENLTVYSLFPQYYHGAKNIKKLIVVSNRYLCYGAYEYGKLVHFAACNTGKEKTPTYPGRYSLVWKKKEHLSSLDSSWVMPFNWNFHQYAGCAFHQFSMPGYAASHSCVRQFKEDAEWLYYWGEKAKLNKQRTEYEHLSGTPVIVLDVFDYTRPKTGPWIALKSNKAHIIELPEKPMEVEDAIIPYSQIPDGAKGRLPNKERYIHGEDTLRARGIIREGVVLTKSVNFNVMKRKKKAAEERERKRLEEEKIKELEKTAETNGMGEEYFEEVQGLKKVLTKPDSIKNQ